jgi:hypothetical protein
MAERMAALTDADRQRLCTSVHEAGHAVAATVLGGRISTAVVFDRETAVVCHGKETPMLGKTVHDEVPTGTLPMITYAGPWAEARFLAGARPTHRDLSSVLNATGHLDDKALCAGGGYREGAPVVPLLERCWPSVVTVAKRLLRDGEVGHEAVCAALGLTDGGGCTSYELALIRSGCAPGTFTTT